ncbi:MAG: HemK/PrmC family methyltransferase [Candidatus Margulisiibacteriota bacterium]|jgi:release factor glutamine methyltransferase
MKNSGIRNIKQMLDAAVNDFITANVDSPLLAAEILLSAVLGTDRLGLYTEAASVPAPEQAVLFASYVQRRSNGEPLQYIINKAWFLGREFYVDKNVLIPRPETEGLVESVKNSEFRIQNSVRIMNKDEMTSSPLCQPPRLGGEGLGERSPQERLTSYVFVDIGTGSGCIAISLKKQFPDIEVYATDISASALAVAARNAKAHDVHVNFRQGDLLAPVIAELADQPVFIVSNPPYISPAEWQGLQREVKEHEPKSALLAENDGMEFYHKILEQANALNVVGIALECGYAQAEKLVRLVKASYPDLQTMVHNDLSGIPRVVLAYKVY